MTINRPCVWILGLITTITYLGVLAIYVGKSIGWANIGNAPIEIMGNFLEGAFAPLAFLWLVIGYFLQKKELMQNTDAIKMQYIEIQKSARQTAAPVAHELVIGGIVSRQGLEVVAPGPPAGKAGGEQGETMLQRVASQVKDRRVGKRRANQAEGAQVGSGHIDRDPGRFRCATPGGQGPGRFQVDVAPVSGPQPRMARPAAGSRRLAGRPGPRRAPALPR